MRPFIALDGIVLFFSGIIAQLTGQDILAKAIIVAIPTSVAIIGNVVVILMKKNFMKSMLKEVVTEVYQVQYIERVKALEAKIAEQAAQIKGEDDAHKN